MRPLLRRLLYMRQIERGRDEREMRERLRKISEHALLRRVVLFGEQPDVVAERKQSIDQLFRFLPSSAHRVRIGEPEAASEKRAFVARQSVDLRRGVVAMHED